jgi:hypothetical protein
MNASVHICVRDVAAVAAEFKLPADTVQTLLSLYTLPYLVPDGETIKARKQRPELHEERVVLMGDAILANFESKTRKNLLKRSDVPL